MERQYGAICSAMRSRAARSSSPNAAGWYNGDVGVHWTASDALSGVAAPPADTLVTGEGADLSSSSSVSDKAGNGTTARSADLPGARLPHSSAQPSASAPESVPMRSS